MSAITTVWMISSIHRSMIERAMISVFLKKAEQDRYPKRDKGQPLRDS